MVYGLNPNLVIQEIIPNSPTYYKFTSKNYMLNFGMSDANSLQWKNDSIVTIQMIQFSRRFCIYIYMLFYFISVLFF
jgi:hypothetical protein